LRENFKIVISAKTKKSSKISSSFIWHRIKIFKKDAFIFVTNWASIQDLFIMLEWIKERFKLLQEQEKSEHSNKGNGKEQKKKKPFEDSSSDDEDDLTPNLNHSQNKVKRKVMDSSSSDEEEAEVQSAKDKGEEESNLSNLRIMSVCDQNLLGLFIDSLHMV
jgi:hypothetical protein